MSGRDCAGLGDFVPHAIGVVILEAGSTDFDVLIEHLSAVTAAIAHVAPGAVLRVGG